MRRSTYLALFAQLLLASCTSGSIGSDPARGATGAETTDPQTSATGSSSGAAPSSSEASGTSAASGGGGATGGGGASSGGGPDPVLLGAGDIGMPGGAQSATGDLVRMLLGANPGANVFTLGDNAYGDTDTDQGSPPSYASYYDPHWGSFIDRTLPNPGNHDYGNWDLGCCGGDGAARVMEGYYAYFAGHALAIGGTTPTSLHYGYDLTTSGGKLWRYVSLDSGFCFYTPENCAVGSSEYGWLKDELDSHRKIANGGAYTGLIVGTHFDANESQECGGSNQQIDPMFQLMYDYGVDLYAAGHVHNYERFCNLAKDRGTTTQQNCGTLTGPVCDPSGPMEINVGTGGADSAGAGDGNRWAASVASVVGAPGVLKLTLHDATWDFDYIDTSGTTRDASHGIPVH